MSKRIFARAVFAIAAICAAPDVSASRAVAADTYEIHVILPITGGVSFLGQAEKQALELAEPVVNKGGGIQGRPVHFVFHDDQSSPQTGVQLASQVLALKPSVVLGSSLVGICNAMAPLMQNGPVMYCFSPGIHPPTGSYVFTSSVSTLDLAAAQIRYFRMKGWTRIALMTSTDATGQDAERGITGVLQTPENKDVTLVQSAHFNPTDVSVSAQIERIKASDPQAMIAWTTGASIATIFKGIVQAELDIPIATTNGNQTYAQMAQYAAFLPKSLYMPSSEWPEHEGVLKLDPQVEAAQKRIFEVYKAANVRPDVSATLAWDPAMIVVDGLRQLGPNATAQQLRDYIAHLTGYAGINGIYDFQKEPQRGLDVNAAVVTLWNANKGVWEVVSKPTGVPLAP